MTERDPNLVTSGLSGEINRNEVTIELCIYRLEHEDEWSLEVVNSNGTSIVWDKTFSSDQDAYDVFEKTVKEEGMNVFLDGAEIIQFPR